MTGKILFMEEVEKLTRLSRPTIDKYIKENGFPKPSWIGPRKAWYESTVNAWLDDQMVQGNGNNDNT